MNPIKSAILLIIGSSLHFWSLLAAGAETNFLLQRQGFVAGGIPGQSANFALLTCSIGHQSRDDLTSSSFHLNSGYVRTMVAPFPVQTHMLTNQLWEKGSSRPQAFDLDDFFNSPERLDLFYSVIGASQISVNIHPLTHVVSFAQPPGFAGVERVRFIATDSDGNNVSSGSVALYVHNPVGNNPPVLNPIADIVTREGDRIAILNAAFDPDGNPVTITFSSPFNANGTWQTDFGSAGRYEVIITASDGQLQDSLTINVTVADVNRPPNIGYIEPITVTVGALVALSPQISDPDGHRVTVSFDPPLDQNGRWQTTGQTGGIYDLVIRATDGDLATIRLVRLTVLGDADGDGLNDREEIYIYGTDPHNTDTDGDGMPDGWEVAHGLNPLVDDANEDRDLDGLTNLHEFQYSQSHTDQLDPSNAFSNEMGVNDYEFLNPGQHLNRFYYDRNDRLIGAEYSAGLSIAYTYDGNGNLLRQTHLSRTGETNGLPALWKFLNGLADSSPINDSFGDADGDGWSNWQEWKAGTCPTNAASRPDLLSPPGTAIASLQLPFTPSNFVVAVGQLDGEGAEEIVIGADGDPMGTTNSLFLLSEGPSGWIAQRIDVGSIGVTSVAIGQPTNAQRPAAYFGTRVTTNTATVMELRMRDSEWQLMPIVTGSTGRVATVIGVRSNADVVVQFSQSNAPPQALFSLQGGPGLWNTRLLSANTATRGLGGLAGVIPRLTTQRSLRLIDTGKIELNAGSDPNLALAAYYPFNGNAEDATTNGNHGDVLNATLTADRFGNPNSAYSFDGDDWINLPDQPWELGTSSFTIDFWVLFARSKDSKLLVARSFDPRNTFELQLLSAGLLNFRVRDQAADIYAPFTPNLNEWCQVTLTKDGNRFSIFSNSTMLVSVDDSAFLPNSIDSGIQIGCCGVDSLVGKIDDVRLYTRALTVNELSGSDLPLLLEEPGVAARWIGQGHSLCSGMVRKGNSTSIIYVFGDDKNHNNTLDLGDDFVVSEYALNGTAATLLTFLRQPITGPVAQSYGLAAVNFLNSTNTVILTGEPDGRIAAWTAQGTNALDRQIFSSAYKGKAWHALASVKAIAPGEEIVGLLVDPATPKKCDVILWPPQRDLPAAESFPQTAPVARMLPIPAAGGNLANVGVRIWDAEGNASLPLLQFSPDTINWFDVTNIVQVDGARYSLATRVQSLPGGSDHSLVWNAGARFGSGITNIFLRTRAKDVTLLGDWSEPMPYQLTIIPDSDGDGLPDDWEMAAFGTLSQDGSADPDGDGFTNLEELLAGTNPMDRNSSLKLRIERLNDSVKLSWQGGSNAAQVLQRSFSLQLGWQDVMTNPASVPGVYANPFMPTNLFFQLRLLP